MKLPSPLFAPFAHIFNLCSSHYRMQIKCNTCAIEYKVQSAKINCGVALLPTMQVGSQQNQFEWHTMLQKGIEGLIAEHMAITAKPRVEVLKTIDHFLWNRMRHASWSAPMGAFALCMAQSDGAIMSSY